MALPAARSSWPVRATPRRCSPRRPSSTRSSCPTGPSCGRAASRWPTTWRGARCAARARSSWAAGWRCPSIAAARAGGRVLATDWSPDAVAAAAATPSATAPQIETLVCDWAAPGALLERAPVPAGAGLGRALRAAQRGPAARPAPAARGRARAHPARRSRAGARRALPRGRARRTSSVTTTMSPASRGWRFTGCAAGPRAPGRARGRTPRRAGGSRAGSSRSGAWKASSSVAKPVTTLSIPRADSAASSGIVPPSGSTPGPVPQARSIASAASRSGRAGSNRAGRRARHLDRDLRPAGAAARSSRSSSAPISSALCPAASRTVTWAEATPARSCAAPRHGSRSRPAT